MQDQIELDKLSQDSQIETGQYLSNRDLVSLSRASKHHFALFKPLIAVRKLLHHVVCGEHDAVKAMLEKDMSLMFERGFVTDCSGREFKNISGFEYALWALDKYMWTAMIACIPQNEEGRKVFEQLIAQYNKVNTIGVTYRFNGKTTTENHFDFNNTIIKELQTQVDSINVQGNRDWVAINIQWIKGVGGAQKLLPMHVVDEYCSNEPFYLDEPPRFTSQPEPAKKSYDYINEENKDWFRADSKLSISVAMYKGNFPYANPWDRAPVGTMRHPLSDLNAMVALCEVRTADFIKLKSQLEEQLTKNHKSNTGYIRI
ncbi:hypothetical protein EP47_11940 [Legionella norrlandica]|uniref:SidC homolog n=1 Tax=Legionella norrlandica TaxID=1498499 RepID=A0A0A2SUN9_9GAMM|nr:hypothetical protein [Legionella norrlandica]KGP64467.1 hypothetical protein EP47_11940 [Legionella norrlandica]